MLGWLSGVNQAGTCPSHKVTSGPSPPKATPSPSTTLRLGFQRMNLGEDTFRPQLQSQTKLSLEAEARAISVAGMMLRGPGSTQEAHSLPPTLQAPSSCTPSSSFTPGSSLLTAGCGRGGQPQSRAGKVGHKTGTKADNPHSPLVVFFSAPHPCSQPPPCSSALLPAAWRLDHPSQGLPAVYPCRARPPHRVDATAQMRQPARFILFRDLTPPAWTSPSAELPKGRLLTLSSRLRSAAEFS